MAQTEITTRKGETEVAHTEDAISASEPSTGYKYWRAMSYKVFDMLVQECPDGVSLEDIDLIFECIKDRMYTTKMVYD